MDEAIQIALAICPLVIIDVAGVNTYRLQFRRKLGASEFALELDALSDRVSVLSW